MENNSLTVIDINVFTAATGMPYANAQLTAVNDHVIRISVMTEPYFWHLHPNSDESFLIIEGIVIIDLEDRLVELHPGQFFTIPKNVKHRTRPKGAHSVNITFERENTETVKVAELLMPPL